jgi:hypothetical protein
MFEFPVRSLVLYVPSYSREGRAIAQAIIRSHPTTAARVRAQVKSCEICGGQSGARAAYLRILLFLLPFIPPTTPHSSSIFRVVAKQTNSRV